MTGPETAVRSGFTSKLERVSWLTFGSPIPVRVVLVVLAICGGLLLLDYAHTRSATDLSLTLSRLGPGTALDAYVSEFGQPTYHFTDVDVMRTRGPLTDDSLLQRTELYYFFYHGLPYRYFIVYMDKSTRRAVVVTWKYM
jgi:hypothetical protein